MSASLSQSEDHSLYRRRPSGRTAVTLSGTAEFIPEDSPERAELEWRILRRYHNSDEDAHRYQAWIAEQGADALIAVSPERIIGWDFNG